MEADEAAAVVGASRKFECQVVGYPPPVIRWFKDEAEITHEARYKFSHEARDGTVSMHIDNIRLSDAGLYKCRAENCEGYALTAAHLTVKAAEPKRSASTAVPQSADQSPTATKAAVSEGTVKMKVVQEVFQKPAASAVEASPSSRRRPLTLQSSTEGAPVDADIKVNQTAPVFIRKPESTKVTENDSVTLTCRVQGTPKPTVTWFHQGRVLQPDGQKSFSSTDDEHCFLIGRCYTADAGEYTCTATNAAGAIYCSCTLTVADALSEEGSSSDSEYSLSSYRRLSAVVEEDSSTDTLSDKPKLEFLREMIVTTQYVDSGKKITFKPGDLVEILDTAKTDRWLVRSKRDSLQVGYIPRSCLGEAQMQDSAKASASATEAPEGTEDAATEDSTKTGAKKRDEKQLKGQNSKRLAENVGDSSGDEASSPDAEVYPVFVAVADYESEELKICEGQFLEVIDRSNPISWLVRTKPTKTNGSRVGMMPASYLEVKDGVGHVDRRSTREVFREDIIQITDKQTEASVKRRYTLAELLEAENDYIADLEELIDKLKADQTAQLPEKERVLEELAEFHSFHKESFLPDLMQCTGVPADVADAFLSWKSLKSASEAASSQQCFETPLSHIRKYQSLLKDFIRYTARSGGDCEKLEKALNMLLYVSKCIDDQEVMHQLKDCPPGVMAQKPLLRHESVTMSCSDEDSSKGKDRHLFLFPESLLITRLTKTPSLSEEYQYKESLVLKNIKLNDSVSTDDKKFELFYISENGRYEMYVVQTKNDFSKEAWLRDLENILRAQGIEKCYITEQERTDFLQKKASSGNAAVTASSRQQGAATVPVATGKSQAVADYSTGTETDQYLTAAESEMSSYCTAQESADDGTQDGGGKGSDGTYTGELDNRGLPTAPTFVEQLIPTVSEDGVSATFECRIAGNPTPDVSWYFQGKLVAEDGHYSLTANDQYEYSMIIHDLTVDDAGLYTIKALNMHGEVFSRAELKVDPPTAAPSNSSSGSDAAAAVEGSAAAAHVSMEIAAPAAAAGTAQASGTAATAAVAAAAAAEVACQDATAPGQDKVALAATSASNVQPPTASLSTNEVEATNEATGLSGIAQSTVMLAQSTNDNYVATLNATDGLDSSSAAEQASQQPVIEAVKSTAVRAAHGSTRAPAAVAPAASAPAAAPAAAAATPAPAAASAAAAKPTTRLQKAEFGSAIDSNAPKISDRMGAENARGDAGNNQRPAEKQQQPPNTDATSSSVNGSTEGKEGEEEDKDDEGDETPSVVAAADEQSRSPASPDAQSVACDGVSAKIGTVDADPEVTAGATDDSATGDSSGDCSTAAGLQADSPAQPVPASTDRPKLSDEPVPLPPDACEDLSKSTAAAAAAAALPATAAGDAAEVPATAGCNIPIAVAPAEDDVDLAASDESKEGPADASNDASAPNGNVEQRNHSRDDVVDEDEIGRLAADGDSGSSLGKKREEDHHCYNDVAPAETKAVSTKSHDRASAGTGREQRLSTARSISDDWPTGLSSSDDSEDGEELALHPVRQARQYTRANADADVDALPARRGRISVGRNDDDDDYDGARSGRRQDSSRDVQRDVQQRQRMSRLGSEPAPRRSAATVAADDGDWGSGLRQGRRQGRNGTGNDDMPEERIARSQTRELERATLASPFNLVGPSMHASARTVRQMSLPPTAYTAMHKRTAPPVPVSEKPEVKQAGADHFVLLWTPPESHRDKQLNISYIVEYRSTADSDWRRLARSVRESFVKLDIPARETQYRVRAENEYGVSDPSLIVSGPWVRPKVERSISVTPPVLATPPSLPCIRTAMRRSRARSCDNRLVTARHQSAGMGGEWLLNVAYPSPGGQQSLTIAAAASRRSHSGDREPSFGSVASAATSSSEFRLSCSQHSHLPASLRRRLSDLKQDMASEVESILSESRLRVAAATASRRADRYRSRSECRQLSPAHTLTSLGRPWDDDKHGPAASDRRSATQKRLVMPTMATHDRISLEQQDYSRMDGSTHVTLGNYAKSFDVRGGSSYYSRESRLRSDYEYADVARRELQLQKQQQSSSTSQYRADSSAHYYHYRTGMLLDGDRTSPAMQRSGSGGRGALSLLSPSRTNSPAATSSPRSGTVAWSSLDGDFLVAHGSGRHSGADRTLSVRAGEVLGLGERWTPSIRMAPVTSAATSVPLTPYQ